MKAAGLRLSLLSATVLTLGLAACGAPEGDGLSGGLGPERAGERAREILAAPEPFERTSRFAGLLLVAGPDALEPVRAALDASFIGHGEPELVVFAMWWARFDPEAAFAWSVDDARADAWGVVREIFRAWARSDPDTAFARLADVPSHRQDPALDGLVAGWHDSDRPGLVEQVRGIPDLVSQQRMAEKLAEQLVARRGAEGAIRWLEELPPSGFRAMLGRRIASAAAWQGDAAAVADWAAALVTAGDERPSGLPRRIATRWLLRDPEAAWAWLESLPAGKDRDDGVMEAFRDWSRLQPGPAVRWIREVELEPWLEPAFAIYARRLSHRQPEEAIQLLERFSDEEERDRFLVIVLRNWASKDPAAARAWLDGADLDEAMRERAEAELKRAAAQQGGDRPAA